MGISQSRREFMFVWKLSSFFVLKKFAKNVSESDHNIIKDIEYTLLNFNTFGKSVGTQFKF